MNADKPHNIRKTNALKILKALSKSRYGLNARQLFNELLDLDNLPAVRAELSRLVREKYLQKDGKLECPECGHNAICYRITEKGRIRLADMADFLTI